MEIKKNVHSSNLTFKQLEVNVDTVFYRFNEKEWIEKDEETGEEVQLGWVYDEIWYDKDSYIEEISSENQELKDNLAFVSDALNELLELTLE